MSQTFDFSLGALAEEKRISDWVFKRIRPHLGERILEVGCGIGTYTTYLADVGKVVGIDPSADEIAHARKVIGDRADLRVATIEQAKRDIEGGFDSAVCINVLEHIPDHVGTLRGTLEMLRPGGTLVLLVPAGKWLYGTLDEAFEHERRYGKRELSGLLTANGYTNVGMKRFNMLGVPGWFVAGKVLRQRELKTSLLGVYGKIMSPFAWFEDHVGAPFGLSLIATAQRPLS